MRLAKFRLIVSLIIAVAIVIFVLISTKWQDEVLFSVFGTVKPVRVKLVILLSLGVGFVLGYLFRITRFFRKRPLRKAEK